MVKNLPAMPETRVPPGSGGSPGEGNGNPLQYSCPENSIDRGAWGVIVHGVTNMSRTGLESRVFHPKSQTLPTNQHTSNYDW